MRSREIISESAAAQMLANILSDCYGASAVRVPDVWRNYQRFMQHRWRLTNAESRVAVECIKGKTNNEIAAAFGLSIETVNKHLDAVYEKAQVVSRGQLAALVLQEVGR